MQLTNKEAISLAQSAYFNFTKKEIAEYMEKHNDQIPTIRDLLVARCKGEDNVANGIRDEAYKAYYAYFNQCQDNFDEVKQFIDGILGVKTDTDYSSIDSSTVGVVWDTGKNNTNTRNINGIDYYILDIADWRVGEICEDNYGTGLYALTLFSPVKEGEKENAVVTFRGSEKVDNTDNNNNWIIHIKDTDYSIDTFVKDWLLADAGIGTGEVTVQEWKAAEYLNSVLLNDSIASVASVGHSLGGDLALVSAVLVASDNDKYIQGVSFDGPGQKQEFIERFSAQISALNQKSKLEHYYYTIVGEILDSFAGIDYEVKLVNPGDGGGEYHSLYNIDLSGNNVIEVPISKSQNTKGNFMNWLTNFVDSFDVLDNFVTEGLIEPLTEFSRAYLAVKCDGLDEEYEFTDEGLKSISTGIYHLCDYAGNFSGNRRVKALAQVMGLEIEVLNMLDQFERGNYRTGTCNLIEYICEACGELAMSRLFGNTGNAVGVGKVGVIIKNSILSGIGQNAGKTVSKYLGEAVCELFNIQDKYGSMSQTVTAQSIRQARASLGSAVVSGINCLFSVQNNGSIATNNASKAWSTNYQNLLYYISNIGNLFVANSTRTYLGKKINVISNPLDFLQDVTNYYLTQFGDQVDKTVLDGDDSELLSHPLLEGFERMLINHTLQIRNSFSGVKVYSFDRGDSINNSNASQVDVVELYFQFVFDSINSINLIYNTAIQAVRYNPDPLVLDLDADGVSLLSKQLGVYFDEDAQGLREKTQWISAEDALLAIDLNNNGIIDGGDELFGTSTLLADGSIARTGFEALLQYDSNSDGIIDIRDEIFERLLVWRDQNIDGITDDGELESLVSHGIESISLNAESEETGRRSSVVHYSDGHEARIMEVDFEADYYDSREKETLEISDAIKELPNIQAIGNIPSLHSLMQQDESGELTGLVEAFMEAETVDEREAVCTQIIYRISGADAIEAGSRGTEFDAKKLAVIEAFMGRAFVGTAGNNPVNTAATILSGVYDSLFNLYYGLLAKESVLKPYLPLLYMYESDEGERYIDTTYFDFIARLSLENGDDLKNVIPEMARFIAAMNPDNPDNLVDFANKYMDFEGYAEEFSKCRLGITIGTSEGDSISAGNDVDRILAGLGNDVVYGNNGNDDIYGNGGDDTLYGENGDDVLIGGSGNDRLEGGSGSDTYVFNLGDGVDTVYDYEYDMTPQDRILFGEGISSENVRMERRGNNLVVWYSENDFFTVKDAYRDYYGTGRYFVESIEFSDGIVWNTEDIANKANQILGTDENDTLEGFSEAVGYHQNETFRAGTGNDRVYASNGDDILYGEEGEDTLYGESGDDTLVGGVGSDRLEGGEGSDTYVFNLGDGVDTVYDYEYDMTPQDRILFGEGIDASDVRIERRGNNLVVWYSENDSFTVKEAYRDYYGTGRYFVESIEFADGTVWDTEDIANKANQILGTDGNDTLEGFSEAVGYHQNETFRAGAGNDRVYASNGDDILYGEEGDDTLYGESGDDTLIGGVGSDRLEGGEGSDTYVFNLGDGVDTVYDYEYDMTPQDRILFGEGIDASDVRIERRGNNLVVWYSENDSFTVKEAYRDYYGTGRYFVESIEFSDGTVWGTEDIANKANQILGTDGNDTLEGFSEAVGYHQNETFRGGAGNDRVYASNGDDILYGEEGDDTLYGESGDDTLIGGVGSDRLEGGEGSDTYVFNLGDGVDTVYDYEYDMTPQDRILFGEGISSENVRMERRGNNLVVWYSENDSFTVKDAYRDYYGTGRYFVESIEFSDGTVWGTEDIANKANQILGTDENDTLEGFSEAVGYHQNETFRAGAGNDRVYASNGDDILYGEEGEDTLYGESGDDTLVGGVGSDRLEGGEGSDTYVFNLGDGVDTVYDYEYDMTPQDRILFGEGIDASDVRIERRGNNLVVWYSENDSFTVKDAYRDYYGTGRYFVESIEFSDGTVWDTEDIANKANQILGTDGNDTLEGFSEAVGYHQNETFRAGTGNDRVYASNGDDILYGEEGEDTLYGESGDDTLVGGEGSDRLEGGEGSDTYIFNLGDGVDTVYDYEYDMTPQDRILFGECIDASNVRIERRGSNLVVWYSENDSFTVKDAYRDYYGTGRYFVESIEFFDGTVWGTEDIANKANKILGTDENDTLEGFNEAVGYHQNETFRAGAGNDRVYAANGDDTIYGEDGDDTLYGEDGADILVGGAGKDRLDGGVGNDTYVFNKGDGIDTIFDYEYSDTSGKEDRILFGSGISIEDISLERTGNNLVIKYGETDQVTIDSAYRDYYGIGKYQIERVEFENGTKTVIDYDNESLTVVYQPEPEEEVIEEIEELQEGSEALEESLELYDVDAVVSVMEEVLNGEPVVESGEEISQEESGTVALAETTDIEAERMTNLLIQEMSGADSDNISDKSELDLNPSVTDELLWAE